MKRNEHGSEPALAILASVNPTGGTKVGFLDRFRRVPKTPDIFESTVHEFVAIHGPVGALDRAGARQLATNAIKHALVELNLPENSSGAAMEAMRSSPFRLTVIRDIKQVVHPVTQYRFTETDVIGAIIAKTCFAERGEPDHLNSSGILALVGIAFGVVGELRTIDPSLVEHLVASTGEMSNQGLESTELAKELTRRLMEYGLTSDKSLIGDLSALYIRALDGLASTERLDLLMGLIPFVEEQKISANAFMPFIFHDLDPRVVSTATLHAAGTWPGSESDPMIGVRDLASHARQSARNGEDTRAAAILGGLVSLGDRRVIQCLGACWRFLSPDGRQQLARHAGGRTYAPVLDWLVSWLEECERDEFGGVAGILAKTPEVTLPEANVIEVRRAFPVWSVAADEVITVVSRWSFEEYGKRLRPRLLQIAADEHPPRVMHDVLKCWGIDYNRRLLAGITIQAPSIAQAPRPLIPLIGGSRDGPSELLKSYVPLGDSDFLTRGGQLLLFWSIFNPNGPTWNCLGLLPTEDPDWHCLFYRMLNPFAQESFIVGIVRNDEYESEVVIGSMVEALFARDIGTDMDAPIPLIGGGLPDVVHVIWSGSTFGECVRRGFAEIIFERQLDVVGAAREIRQYHNPWDRVTVQRNDAFARMTSEGFIPLPEHEGETTEETINDWLDLVTSTEHALAELPLFPNAWHGAIDHTAPVLAQNAYTFWQLDDFTARFGFPVFRAIAQALTPGERDHEEG